MSRRKRAAKMLIARRAFSAQIQRKSNFQRKSQRKFSLHAFVLRSSAYAIRLQDSVLAHLVQDIIGLILIKPTQLLSFLIRNRRLMLQIFENPILCLNLADRLILHMRCLSFRWSRPWASGSAHWPRTSSAVDGRFSWVSKGAAAPLWHTTLLAKSSVLHLGSG